MTLLRGCASSGTDVGDICSLTLGGARIATMAPPTKLTPTPHHLHCSCIRYGASIVNAMFICLQCVQFINVCPMGGQSSSTLRCAWLMKVGELLDFVFCRSTIHLETYVFVNRKQNRAHCHCISPAL